uniref:Uncharacterized protein n=1 Tax=Nelumbo nucifera TaxID=4432 RepID=A0A822Y163_NELNU|nr:TPA_asm: hypothetical protein HUJ06_027818 [Nelumbo nucifera]
MEMAKRRKDKESKCCTRIVEGSR